MTEENLKSQTGNHDQDMSENDDVSRNLENLESCFLVNSEANKNDLKISNNTKNIYLSRLDYLTSPLKAEGKRKQNKMQVKQKQKRIQLLNLII